MNTSFNRVVECRHGKFLCNENDIYVGRSLSLYGEYSEQEVAMCCSFLRDDSVVIEGGSNYGAITIPMAKRCHKGALLAFEPQMFIYQALVANIALNSLVNVRPFNAGLAEQPGQCAIKHIDPRKKGAYGGCALGDGNAMVPMMRIDDFPLHRLDLIKLDVEGMESQVLEGAAKTIERFRPVIYLEFDKNVKAILKTLDLLGYAAHDHNTPLFNLDNYNRHPHNIWNNTYSINAICMPKGQDPFKSF